MVEHGDEQSYYNGEVNDNGIPVEDEEYAALNPLYRPVFDIVTKNLSEPAVKAAARDHGIYYNPIDEGNSQRYYCFDWKDTYFPKLQRDVAKYFADQDDGIDQLSAYYIDGDEEVEAEDEVSEEDDFEKELEEYAYNDDALVEEVEDHQFKPIEKLDVNKKQSTADNNDKSSKVDTTFESYDGGFDTDVEESGIPTSSQCGSAYIAVASSALLIQLAASVGGVDSTTFESYDGGFDTDVKESGIPTSSQCANEFSLEVSAAEKNALNASHLKAGIHQSTVRNALNAPKLERKEDCNTFKGEK